jgi:hypothetical protein
MDFSKMISLPKKYYATETKPIHKLGYTVALAMMLVGVAETIHSIPYIVRGESNLTGATLGPIVVLAGGVSAYSYLKEAKVVY